MVRWPWRRGPNYEIELPRLADDLRRLKLKESSAAYANRRWATAFLEYSMSVYVLYVAFVFVFARTRWHMALLASIPFALALLSRTISRFTLYRLKRVQASRELVENRRATLVDAYKKQINYDHVMSIIGESEKANEKADAKANEKVGGTGKDKNAGKPASRKPGDQAKADGKLVNALQVKALNTSLSVAVPVYQTTWVDRLLDLVIGVNENSPASRYALICPHCHAHNGLAPYGKLAEDTPFRCCVCGELVGKVAPSSEVKPESPSVEGQLKSESKETGKQGSAEDEIAEQDPDSTVKQANGIELDTVAQEADLKEPELKSDLKEVDSKEPETRDPDLKPDLKESDSKGLEKEVDLKEVDLKEVDLKEADLKQLDSKPDSKPDLKEADLKPDLKPDLKVT